MKHYRPPPDPLLRWLVEYLLVVVTAGMVGMILTELWR